MSAHNITFGDTAGFWYEYPLCSAARQKGSRIILTGWGGDELSTYHGHSHLVSMLQSGDVATICSTIKTQLAGKKRLLKPLLNIIYRNLIIPFVPATFYCKMPKIVCKNKYSYRFIKKDFLPLIRQDQKNSVLTTQPATSIKKHMLTYLKNGHLQARVESWAASSYEHRLEYCYPLLDKRIVEFILGVPAKYFVKGKMGRYLYRIAAKNLLPDDLLWNNEKREIHRTQRLVSISCQAFLSLLNIHLEKQTTSEFVSFRELQKVLKTSSLEERQELVPELGLALLTIQCESLFDN